MVPHKVISSCMVFGGEKVTANRIRLSNIPSVLMFREQMLDTLTNMQVKWATAQDRHYNSPEK